MMKVLISGAGIAGPALAYWLTHYGFEPTLVELAPQLRTGGYVIDFWGVGFDIADRMGLLPELRAKGYIIESLKVLDQGGRTIASCPADVFARATNGRYVTIARGDLAAAIFGTIVGKVETLFGDSISSIEQTEKSVLVRFEHGATREFDLLVGADGLHSRVRELVFGPQSGFEQYLGCKVAALEVSGYRPRDELVYVLYTEVGQQVARFALHGDRTLFLFTFADSSRDTSELDPRALKRLLHERFGNSGWECPRILEALNDARDLYFDRMSQIHMESRDGLWSSGRVTLLGDAASCPSLLAGEGSGLAMLAAYILAGELHRAEGDYGAAYRRYQEMLVPFMLRKQKAALRAAGFFAPRSKWYLFLRNRFITLMRWQFVAKFGFGDFTRDMAIPEY